MDILGLGFDAVQASHQHGRLDVYHGFNFPSGNTESVTIVINGYDTHNAKFDVEVFDASFKYIVVNPCTKDNWVKAYRKARTIKSAMVAKHEKNWLNA
ncbi:hypothetical protein [Moritella viscosa]|uniref:Acetylornithine deacetylase n=1 Tax=Moritella viscosa TaxID=80854 RepID=A0ABY1H8H8_9GAMM|nr:hypothetical protein [Moritella viscosa]SGY85190.1 Acetylornithine deacetylase [Moritella viscosa]SGY87442.1 Acetylornithine deacetylase [Moritella viscosa]SHO04137.1 Acetylornithine deacetylase [Moritella viscosa]SHO24716.1 Acetylornithine deacetylase [Moritella viscosa]